MELDILRKKGIFFVILIAIILSLQVNDSFGQGAKPGSQPASLPRGTAPLGGPPPPPSFHLDCFFGTCMSFGGQGEDQCSSNDDCTRLACGDSMCKLVNEKGSDTCTINSDCLPANKTLRAFVTSNSTLGNFGGLIYGDAKCFSAAKNAGMTSNWTAWLSAFGTNAKDRIPNARYIRPDGGTIADNKADLIDGNLDNPINQNEFGVHTITNVWTGTSGFAGVSTFKDCNGWQTLSSGIKATIGDSNSLSSTWSDNGLFSCATFNQANLYCFENTVSSAGFISSCQPITSPGTYILVNNLTSPTGTCITINANNVILDCNNFWITGNGNGNGIEAFTTGSTIKNCNINNFFNSGSGIIIITGKSNRILNNKLINNAVGLKLYPNQVNNNTVMNNLATRNSAAGFLIQTAFNSFVNNNASFNTGSGFTMQSLETIYNNFTLNTVMNNAAAGFFLQPGPMFNKFTDNQIRDNAVAGIFIDELTTNNLFHTNNITGNTRGVYAPISTATNNLFYNNYFKNSINGVVTGLNTWNTTKIAARNIVGGPFIAGNFWHDYLGNDSTGFDGIGDTMLPYNSNGNILVGGDYQPIVINDGPAIYYCQEITKPGNYYLIKNIAFSGLFRSSCIKITASNANFDCRGYMFSGESSLGLDNGDTFLVIGDNNVIKNCVMRQSGRGFAVSGSSNNVLNNTIYDMQEGINLGGTARNNLIINNIVFNNTGAGYGLGRAFTIWCCGSGSVNGNNTITGNRLTNSNYGIDLGTIGPITGNLFYNNYIANNARNANEHVGLNFWNITKTPGTNIIGGPFLGGNFWSDYAGADTDGDGLGDTQLPHTSGGNIQNGGDYRPLK